MSNGNDVNPVQLFHTSNAAFSDDISIAGKLVRLVQLTQARVKLLTLLVSIAATDVSAVHDRQNEFMLVTALVSISGIANRETQSLKQLFRFVGLSLSNRFAGIDTRLEQPRILKLLIPTPPLESIEITLSLSPASSNRK